MDIRREIDRMELPVIAAPMFLVSGPELVLAACREGIIGCFPTPNCRDVETLDQWLLQITSGIDELKARGESPAPWSVNLVVHSTNERLPDDLDLVQKYKVPIVITALGSPARVVNEVHGYGGIVFADVNSIELAKKAIDTGVDGLILLCSGAGGHTGSICNFAFVDEIREFWDGYVVVAGGISNGRAVRAIEIIGGDLAYVGTSFIPTEESMAVQEHKDMVVAGQAKDLMVTKAFTGANANMLVPSIVNKGLDPKELVGKEAKMKFTGQEDMEVKPWKGIYTAGQGLGACKSIESTKDLVARLRQEYQAACLDPKGTRLAAAS